MKKLLFATTALVATAGVAAAEVTLSGSAEMGIVGGDAYDDVTQFHTDIDVKFTLSGETDNGLSFGATIDLDEEGGFASTNGGPESVFISGGGATLTMGDTDGAFDAALTEVGIGGAIDDAHTSHVGFSGNSGFDGTLDGQVARFSYAFDGFTGHLSVEVDDTKDANGDTSDPVWGIGVAYTADLAGLDIGVGLGYQTTDDNGSVVLFDGNNNNGTPVRVGTDDFDSVAGISLSTTFDNGLQAILNYSQYSGSDTAEDTTHVAVGIGYQMGALTIGFNYGKWDFDDNAGVDGSASGYGLAVDYDLGGGAEIQFGYGVSQFDVDGTDIDDVDQFSLGVAMSF